MVPERNKGVKLTEFLASISRHDLGFLGARVTLVGGSSDNDPSDTSVEFSTLLMADEFIPNWDSDKRDESESSERSE
jgi:hypothetical protein